jgi:hypothetical protein
MSDRICWNIRRGYRDLSGAGFAQRGIAAQEHRQPEPKALDELGVHRGNCIQLLRGEAAAALSAPGRKFQQIVGDDIAGRVAG